MAKLGRYSADRKKIEALTASKAASVSNCGTIFTAVGDAALTLTLPSIADAGEGWWCKVIKIGAASGGQDITVSAHADDGGSCVIGVESSNTCEAIAGDDLVIEDAGAAGGCVEVICDGTRWIALSYTDAAGGMTDS